MLTPKEVCTAPAWHIIGKLYPKHNKSKSPPVAYPLDVPGLTELASEWAKDDRLWTTQETVAFNLTTFGRAVLQLKL